MQASCHNNVPLFVIYPSRLDPSHSIVVSGAQSLAIMVAALQDVESKIIRTH